MTMAHSEEEFIHMTSGETLRKDFYFSKAPQIADSGQTIVSAAITETLYPNGVTISDIEINSDGDTVTAEISTPLATHRYYCLKCLATTNTNEILELYCPLYVSD